MIKRIHVNQHVIRANQRTGACEAPIRIKTSRENIPCYSVQIHGASSVVYSPERPLSCGARLWIETTAPVSAVTAPGREFRELA